MVKQIAVWMMIALMPLAAFAQEEPYVPPITTTPTKKQPSVSPAAAQAMAAQQQAAMMNMMAAGMLTAACLAPCPKCMTPLCVMGAMAAMQGMHDSGAAAQSSTVYDTASNLKKDTDVTTQQPTTSPVTNPGSKNLKSGTVPASVLAANKLLEEQGYKVDENGVTNPDGSFTPSSAFSSPGSMAAAGMDPNVISEAQKILSGVGGSGANIPSLAVDGGGGSGPPSATGNEADSSYNAKNSGMTDAQRKALLAGKTIMFGGEPIGVKGDNIFDMMHVAYQKKTEAKTFILDTGFAPANVRAPASVPLSTSASAAKLPKAMPPQPKK